MLGKPVTELLTKEASAEKVVNELKSLVELERTEKVEEAIQRNAKHLSLVLDGLDIDAAKRSEYQKLIDDNLVE